MYEPRIIEERKMKKVEIVARTINLGFQDRHLQNELYLTLLRRDIRYYAWFIACHTAQRYMEGKLGRST